MMQRPGAEMAGFSDGAGVNFPNWASYESQVFPQDELSRYICHIAGNTFVNVSLSLADYLGTNP